MTRRVAVITPICAAHDAISAAAADNFALLATRPDTQATMLTGHDGRGLGATIVPGVDHLLAAPAFREADMLLYHFGIYHPFHDAMLVGNGHARQVVVFHNVTPAAHVAPRDRPLIERSLRQAHNIAHADEIWADSPFNAADAAALGADPARIHVIPLAVARPAPLRLAQKPRQRLELLFLGRIVPSKGVHHLAAALAAAAPALPHWHLTIAGNTAFSDAAYLDACRAQFARAGLAAHVTCIDSPDDAALASLYGRAHILCIPSYHEGFCVPVVEGLRAGCIPLATTAGNFPAITAGLGRLVPPGDEPALAEALLALTAALATNVPLPLDTGPVSITAFDERAAAHVAQFQPDSIAARKHARIDTLLATLPPNPHRAPAPAPAPAPGPLAARPASRSRLLPRALAALRHPAPGPEVSPAPPTPPPTLTRAEQAAFRRLAFAARPPHPTAPPG